jgi:hypothetical protein
MCIALWFAISFSKKGEIENIEKYWLLTFASEKTEIT